MTTKKQPESNNDDDKKTRNANGESSIYKGKDKYWHGRVTVGVKDDGKADRRHVMSKDRAVVVRKVRALERERDQGNVAKAGQKWTVAKWLDHWLHNIATASTGENGWDAYEVAVRVHLIPGLGAHKLKKLEPEHLEKLYAKMQDSGSSAGTAHQAHRTMRTALAAAHKRGHVTRNVAALASAPKLDDNEVEPYSVSEVKRLLEEAKGRRNGARWAIALALGLRQGEVLGLKWSDVDMDNGVMRVRENRLRPKWVHGCRKPCGKKPGYCPQRKNKRKTTGKTKSKAGRRRVGLPDEIAALLKVHKEKQDEDRQKAGQLWHEEGWVFAKQNGEAVVPNTDYHNWQLLLKAAGVERKRLHDARHTAATVLLILGVPERTVMDLMGWSSTSMAKRYQHVTDPIRKGVAKQVGGLVWEMDEDASDDEKSSTNKGNRD